MATHWCNLCETFTPQPCTATWGDHYVPDEIDLLTPPV